MAAISKTIFSTILLYTYLSAHNAAYSSPLTQSHQTAVCATDSEAVKPPVDSAFTSAVHMVDWTANSAAYPTTLYSTVQPTVHAGIVWILQATIDPTII